MYNIFELFQALTCWSRKSNRLQRLHVHVVLFKYYTYGQPEKNCQDWKGGFACDGGMRDPVPCKPCFWREETRINRKRSILYQDWVRGRYQRAVGQTPCSSSYPPSKSGFKRRDSVKYRFQRFIAGYTCARTGSM